MTLHKTLAAAALLLAASTAALAGEPMAPAEPAPGAAAPRATASLVADVSAVQAGQPFRLGVLINIEKGWHIYWKHPGEAGLATEVKFSLPKGFTAGPLRWPHPATFKQAGDVIGYGYADSVLLIAEVTPPKELAADARPAFAADASWLACRDRCVMGKAAPVLELPAAAEARPAHRELFDEWRAKLAPLAPAFVLKDQDGNEVALSAQRGKVVVLEWFNPDCPFVKRHHQGGTMRDLAARYAGKGVVWLAVNSTHYMDAATTRKWHDEWKLPYPVLIDRHGKVGHLYEAKSTPHMFVINGAGEIVYRGAIDNDPRGREKAPTNYLAKALEDLLAGRPVATPETRPYGCSVKYPPAKTAQP